MQARSSFGLDAVALIVAITLHLLLVAALLLQGTKREPMPEPKRITVNFAEDVGPTSTAPDPVQESQASVAPELGDAAPPPIEYVPPPPLPQPTSAPAPEPRPSPRATSRPQPRPSPRATSQPRPQPKPRPTSRATSSPRPKPQPSAEPTRSGGSRLGKDFLDGRGQSTTTSETRTPAATFGASERAALSAAITRQLRPHWTAPTGVDADKLVSVVSWRLNQDGSLRGRPTCRNIPGSITESNRPQAELHCERAIRAVQLAAPFNLPEQFYDQWDDLEWQFDKRL